MDAHHFDALARSLSLPGSRRGVLGSLLAGALGLLGPRPDEVAAKKKKPCPPCKKRKQGKCKGTLPDGSACPGGTCQGGSCLPPPSPPPPPPPLTPTGPCDGRSDDAACNATGRCLHGECIPPPSCDGAGTSCSGSVDISCCNVECASNGSGGWSCLPGKGGRPCKQNADCVSGSCIGYQCTTPGPGQCQPTTEVLCDGVCIPASCASQCTNSCGTVPLGGSCCGNLICQEEGGPGGPRRCLPA